VHVLTGHDAWVRTAHVSPVDPGRLLTGGGDTTLRLWDLRTGEHAATLKGHADWVRAVRFSAHDPHIAVSAGWEDAENRIRIWDTRVAHTVMTLGGHTDAVRVLLPAPNAAHPLVWAGDVAGGILGHDLRLGGGPDVASVRLEGHTAAITSLALHGESSRLLSASADGTVRVWDTAAAMAEEAAAATTTTTAAAAAAAAAVVGATAEAESNEVGAEAGAVASGEAVLSRSQTRPGPEPCLVFSEHGDWVSSVAVAPDKTVISTSGNGKAMLWDLTTGKSLTTCQEAAAVLVSSAAGDDEATHIAYGLANGEVGTVVMPSRDEAAVDGSYYRKSEAASAMAAAKVAAAAVLGDWFLKKGGWKMVRVMVKVEGERGKRPGLNWTLGRRLFKFSFLSGGTK
jgi:WD40 repeat protein